MLQLKRSEKIKDVDGFEEKYSVTTLGRVWNIRKNKWMGQSKTKSGYYYVTLSKDGKNYKIKVHRLVGKSFIDNPQNKPQINHINGKKSDNRVSNLEWCTARENMQHAGDTGLNKTFKLTYEMKMAICLLKHSLGYRQNLIARRFNVSPPAISYIIKEFTPIALEAGIIV